MTRETNNRNCNDKEIMADNFLKCPLLSASSALSVISYTQSLKCFGGAVFLLGLSRPVSSFCNSFFLTDSSFQNPYGSGAFSIKVAYNSLHDIRIVHQANELVSLVWNFNIPQKVSHMLWRVILNKLPTIDNLRSKNVQLLTICVHFAKSMRNHVAIYF